MSSFYIISEGGDGLGLAVRLQDEGHSVSMSIKDPDLEKRGENLIDKDTPMGPDSVLLADCTGSGSLLDTYKSTGGFTFGGSQIADRLESDRAFASSIFRKCGIQEPNSREFNSWEEAESFIDSVPDDIRLVFKPEGKFSGNLPSYVSYDGDDLKDMLLHFRGIIGQAEPSFVLQEFIRGTCISSEAWFSHDHFILPTNHTLERKQLLPGDIGPSGGCAGNIVWRCEEMGCPLCANLERLEDFLTEVSYNGCIDINSVVDTEGNAYALEFTPRFGYDAFPTLLYGLCGDFDFGGFLESCGKGSGVEHMPLRSGYAAGVRISTPPWPSEAFKSKADLPIRGLSNNDFKGFYPYEVSRQGDELKTSGGVGIIGVAVGWGSDIEDAFAEAYKTCEKLRLPDKQYRNDFVDVFKSDMRKLRLALSVKLVNT